ncbi:MAG: hypothetical protein ABIG95_03405 [Candidatus Woesearchaeota archaeon]
MIDNKQFDALLKEFNEFEMLREQLIRKSRDILKSSKQLIYALHREDNTSAKTHLATIKQDYSQLQKIALGNILLVSEGSYKIAAQEYVEAVCYYGYVVDRKIHSAAQLKVTPSHYLLGLFDLTGELVRKAINDAIKGDPSSAVEIRGFVEQIYGQMIKFDFRESELRRNFDRVKHDIKRLDDLVLSLKLKNA